MTALLSRDGNNFNLACDQCGHMVVNLAATMGTWDVAWGLFGEDGWRGSDLATGPHACGRCEQPAPERGMIEQALDRQAHTPAGRAQKHLTTQDLPDAMMIRLCGDLHHAANAALLAVLRDAADPSRNLIIDLTQVTSIDSGTLSVLVQAHDRAAGRSARVCVVGACPPVRRALRLLCLDRMFPTFATQHDATGWLRDAAPAAVPS